MFDESREDNSVCSLRDSGAGIYVSVFCGYTSRHQERQKEEYTMSQSKQYHRITSSSQQEPNLQQVDALHDVWIYSAFYQYNSKQTPRKDSPTIEALGLNPTSVMDSDEVPRVTCHLDYANGTTHHATGRTILVNFRSHREKLRHFGTKYGTVRLQCSVSFPETNPDSCLFPGLTTRRHPTSSQ